MRYESFTTWADVLAHVGRHTNAYYQAPLDTRPVYVLARVGIGARTGQIRVTPPRQNADPFWADAGHLDRFRFTSRGATQ